MSARRMEYQRSLVTGSSKYAALALRERVARAPIEREWLMVSGKDAETFLNGQLSQDLIGLPANQSRWSLLLEPDGKLLAIVRVWRLDPDQFIIDTEPGLGHAVSDRLRRFLLRVDCSVSEDIMSHTWTAVRGPDAASLPLPTDRAGESTLGIWVPWPETGGFDLLGDTPPLPGDLLVAEAGALDALRIESGWPVVGVDVLAGDLPADVGPVALAASVSFTKGCYTGQELVERMDSRGAQSPRPLRGLILNEGTAVPPAGAEVIIGGEVAGVVTSAAHAAWRNGPVALARVARRVVPPSVGMVRWPEGEAGARLVELPFPATLAYDRVPVA